MISITGTLVGTEAVKANMAALPNRLRARLENTVRDLGLKLQAKVKGKLSDDVLHVRTGRLRRSINLRTGIVAGGSGLATVTAVYARVGTAVSYGRVHELGWSGLQNVAPYARRVGRVKGKGKGADRVTRQGVAFVRAHTRKVNLPERSFLRSSLDEMRPEVQSAILAALAGGVRGP